MRGERFDAAVSVGYRGARRPAVGAVGRGALLLVLAACAPGAPVGTPLPAPDGIELARTLEARTRLDGAMRIDFDWSVSEQGSRGSGQGVARVEAPDRARLDLFLGNGTTVARAALVGGDLRLPAGAPDGVIPPPDLLWAALGVFRPAPGSELVGAWRTDGGYELLYQRAADEEVRYRVDAGGLREVELLEGGHTVHRITLGAGEDQRVPGEATYQNLGAFRELRLTTRQVENVQSFPTDIWSPGR